MEEKEFFEETPDIYTLSDDEGNEFTLEVLDEADFEDGHYLAMLPVYDDPEDVLQDSDPLVIMKQVSEGEEQLFEEIADEEEFSRVADFFSARLEDIFDIEE